MAQSSASCTFRHLVIVHGIGDQQPNETAISFMNEFVRAMPERIRETVEVHSLIKRVQSDPGQPGLPHANDAAYITLADGGMNHVFAFSEVFWQPVARQYLKSNDNQLPIPTFPWAHSINARIVSSDSSFRLVREAIANLQKLLQLLQKLAVVSRKTDLLTNVLTNFLGDVQMYVESDELRKEIDERFFNILENDDETYTQLREAVQRIPKFQNAQWDDDSRGIYIVSHSEGTVVSYYSLIRAALEREKQPGDREWLTRVRGLVTMGSPLDKHYFIWDSRFRTNVLSGLTNPPLAKRIPWFNYWDRSDPVGYCLDQLKPGDPSSDAGKMFEVKFDGGFARYPIPGKAHVDYWQDDDILLDILQKVVGIGGPRTKEVTSRWWGKKWIMQGADHVLYIGGRVVEGAAILWLFFKVMEPLRAGANWLRGDAGALAQLDIKSWIAYVTLFVVAVLIWKLHTTVHKGLVQLWRYTNGWKHLKL